jgi:hypothetical protein
MKKKIGFFTIITVLGVFLGLIGCELRESEEVAPVIQATGEHPVGVLAAGGPELSITLTQANHYLQQAGDNSFNYWDMEIVEANDEYYLDGRTEDTNGNSIVTAISLYESGGILYLRLVNKACTGNPCTFCKFNETRDGCICNNTDTGSKCDYSNGEVSSWSNY